MAGAKRRGEDPRGAFLPLEDPSPPPLLSVSALTARIKEEVDGLGAVRVEGELSGLKRAASGHVYFDLKDEGARLSCAVWRTNVERAIPFALEEGARVIAHGRLDVYPPRGTYSLIVGRLEPLGIGVLLAQLERLKAELAAKGWFDRRRPLPRWPRPIGLVTSRDGAALRDFLRTRTLRWSGYPVRLCHTSVQGAGAAAEIAAAIARLDASGVDVIVVVRGGGSLEDLWAFNELPVAEAIWRASVPVVTGIGHETDTTLADLVADHRAHTPTDAAQTVIPDRAALLSALARAGSYLMAAADAALAAREERLARAAARPVLRGAGWLLDERGRELAHLSGRLAQAAQAGGREAALRIAALSSRLQRRAPREALAGWERRLVGAGERLLARGVRAADRSGERLRLAAGRLEAISPLAVLARGYSVTQRAATGEALTSAAGVAVGEEILTRLHRGSVRSAVRAVEPAGEEEP
ncbi:MAG: exodeoxyribonuclease VII large subunit [Planctomycetota bacterium]